jgi:hypothetical protein
MAFLVLLIVLGIFGLWISNRGYYIFPRSVTRIVTRWSERNDVAAI